MSVCALEAYTTQYSRHRYVGRGAWHEVVGALLGLIDSLDLAALVHLERGPRQVGLLVQPRRVDSLREFVNPVVLLGLGASRKECLRGRSR